MWFNGFNGYRLMIARKSVTSATSLNVRRLIGNVSATRKATIGNIYFARRCGRESMVGWVVAEAMAAGQIR